MNLHIHEIEFIPRIRLTGCPGLLKLVSGHIKNQSGGLTDRRIGEVSGPLKTTLGASDFTGRASSQS